VRSITCKLLKQYYLAEFFEKPRKIHHKMRRSQQKEYTKTKTVKQKTTWKKQVFTFTLTVKRNRVSVIKQFAMRTPQVIYQTSSQNERQI